MKAFILGLALLIISAAAHPKHMAQPDTCGRSNRDTPAQPAATGPVPWHIWIDFDQTLTVNDTIATLGGSTEHWDWEQVVGAYLRDYDAVVAGKPMPRDSFLLDAQLPTTAPKDRWAVHAEVPIAPSKQAAISVIQAEIQKSMVAEFRSIERINLVGIFSRTTSEQLQLVGKSQVELQPGALHALQSLKARKHSVKVCSVNWSKAFIHGALAGAVPMADIVSTDIVAGKLDGKVVTGVDKINLYAAAQAGGAIARTAYIGDSLHDLLAMVWAQVGVLVVPPATRVPKPSLMRVLERAGVRVVPLSQFGGVGLRSEEQGPVVYSTSSWQEIAKVLGEHLV